MQINLDSIHALAQGLDNRKYWVSLVAIIIGAYKAFQWVKGIRTEDLSEVKVSLTSVSTKIDDGFDKLAKKIEETSASQLRSTEFQTSSFVREIQEMRHDFRTFYTQPVAQMAPARARAPRKKKAKVPVTPQTEA